MLFSLGKLLQSLRDKQEQEESTKPFLAATSQVSWRNAALAEDASEKGGEDPSCSPYPHPVPSSPRLRLCGPAGCSMQGGCSWVLGKPCPLSGPYGVLTCRSSDFSPRCCSNQGPQVSLLAARDRSSSHFWTKICLSIRDGASGEWVYRVSQRWCCSELWARRGFRGLCGGGLS